MNRDHPRVRVLVVGVGSIGLRHARCFAATGRADVMICESDAARRARVAEQIPAIADFAELDDALAASPDVMVVATPAHLHIPMALAGARSGCHLLIEKPLSVGDSDDAIDELIREVERRKLVAVVAFTLRSHPALQEMREAVLRGDFGRPLQVIAVCGQHFPTYRPAYREIYYRRHETGGGAIQDALPHVLNAAEWIVGPVTQLAADAERCVLDGVEVEDTVHLVTRHDQVLGNFSLNQHQAPNESTLTVVGTAGTARFEYHRARWSWMREPETDWQHRTWDDLPRDALFIRQAENMLQTVGDGLSTAVQH